LRVTDCGCRLRVTDCGCRLRVTRLRVSIAGHRLRVSIAGHRLRVSIAGHRLRVSIAGHPIAGVDCGSPIAGVDCGSPIAGVDCGSPIAGVDCGSPDCGSPDCGWVDFLGLSYRYLKWLSFSPAVYPSPISSQIDTLSDCRLVPPLPRRFPVKERTLRWPCIRYISIPDRGIYVKFGGYLDRCVSFIGNWRISGHMPLLYNYRTW
jgi:hypothetical protein